MEELLDSTGVLFRLPTADMLSMVACRGQIEEADGRDPGEIDSGDGKSETKPFDLTCRQTSMHRRRSRWTLRSGCYFWGDLLMQDTDQCRERRIENEGSLVEDG